jgi:hypothetical protein
LEPKRRRVDPPQADGLWRAEARPDRHGPVQERHRPASRPEEATGRSLGPAVWPGPTRGRGCRILHDRDGRRGGRWPLLRCRSPPARGAHAIVAGHHARPGGGRKPQLGSRSSAAAISSPWSSRMESSRPPRSFFPTPSAPASVRSSVQRGRFRSRISFATVLIFFPRWKASMRSRKRTSSLRWSFHPSTGHRSLLLPRLRRLGVAPHGGVSLLDATLPRWCVSCSGRSPIAGGIGRLGLKAHLARTDRGPRDDAGGINHAVVRPGEALSCL